MNLEHFKKEQTQAYKAIKNAFEKARLSHAYIFEGDAGTTPMDAALYFAAKALCREENAPCMQCSQCQRVINRTHPNVYIVTTDKTTIVKDDILNLQSEFSKTALENGVKVFIIDQAETMNMYAQNTLLKFLEEPHPDIYGILLTKDCDKLLPTIKSRAQRIHFNKPSEAFIEKAVLDLGYERWLARLAARIASSTDEASQILETYDIETMADAVKQVYQSLLTDESTMLTFQDVCGSFLNSKQDIEMLLHVLTHYQKDLIYDKINNRHQLIFADDIATIERINQQTELPVLLEGLEHMLELHTKQHQFINMRLAFDNLMLDIERGHAHE